MSRDTTIVVVVGAVVLVIAAVIGLGALGTTRTSSVSEPSVALPDPPSGGSSGITFELRTEPGFTIFGVQLQADRHFAFVALAPPEECIRENEDGSREVSTEGGCSILAAHGEITGEGTTSSGIRFVIVETRITEACFDTLAAGDSWPPASNECDPQ